MLGVSGKYRLDQRLGGGGMAEVFLASAVGAEGFSRRVAIKRVLPGYSDNEAFAKMFVDEAQITAQLVHPNIVSVLDFDRDADNRLFLVMELVDGKDLDALASSGLLPIPVVIFVISEVLRGLGFAHDLPVGTNLRGIVHRDVSPHNVLMSWEGEVKVSDFGIAKARSASAATASVFIKGKPAYMSPEQANGQPLDGRSDLFAVGVMLWEMLVGRRLFVGEDTRSTLAAVLFGQIPRPRSMRGDIPKDLERVVMKLLERDLPARYATAELAIADLLDCADAPRAGREVLTAALAERFPDQARVRGSLARARAASLAPGRPSLPPSALSTPADGTGNAHAPTIHARPAAALPSIGAMRNAETRAQRAGRGRLLAILLVTVVASAIAAFAIVTVVRGKRTPEPGSASGSVVATAPVDAQEVSPPPPPPADAPEPVDANPEVAVADAATEDAPKRDVPSVQPRATKYGSLSVTAFPAVTVYADKKRYGDSPITFKLPVGKHAIRLKNDERGYDERLTITITENQTMKIDRNK